MFRFFLRVAVVFAQFAASTGLIRRANRSAIGQTRASFVGRPIHQSSPRLCQQHINVSSVCPLLLPLFIFLFSCYFSFVVCGLFHSCSSSLSSICCFMHFFFCHGWRRLRRWRLHAGALWWAGGCFHGCMVAASIRLLAGFGDSMAGGMAADSLAVNCTAAANFRGPGDSNYSARDVVSGARPAASEDRDFRGGRFGFGFG